MVLYVHISEFGAVWKNTSLSTKMNISATVYISGSEIMPTTTV